jgi:hypothetical protein
MKPLAETLSRLWVEEGRPATGFTLRGEKGAPLNLDSLARVTIKPLLRLAGLEWYSHYSCRRGLATLATEGTGDVMGAAGLIRHQNVATTSTHYVKVREAATLNAASKVERLYIEASVEPTMQQIVPASLQLVESTNGGMRELVETGGLENHCTGMCSACNPLKTEQSARAQA